MTPRDRAHTLVTGGAGYLGAAVVDELIAAGHRVRVLDVLMHGQHELAGELERRGIDVHEGDVRDSKARLRALSGVGAVVHLGAIVGDPACAQDPELSQSVNVDGTRALACDAAREGVCRLVFASTCSNYGRMANADLPIDEDGPLAPVSLYAEQKVAVERWLMSRPLDGLRATCLRFATLYGVAPRMRFDLTVNEFTRDLWADRRLEVFGGQFWRPYVHVRDAARAVHAVLEAAGERVHGKVFNVGRSSENYQKAALVRIIRQHTTRGRVAFVDRDEDPRDYRVTFERLRHELGYEPTMTVTDGVAEILAALEAGQFGDCFAPAFRNTNT